MEIPVIYWSGTGNTKLMAEAIKDGIESLGTRSMLVEVSSASVEGLKTTRAFVLGSPAMGVEELADDMEVFLDKLEHHLQNGEYAGKVAGLFGSYEWGSGQWMRNLVMRMRKNGFIVVDNGIIIRRTPDEKGLERCRDYGRAVIESLR